MPARRSIGGRAAECERILAHLRAQAPRLRARGIRRLSLFGSIARAEARSKSDVDLLLEVDPASHFSVFDLVELRDDLSHAARAADALRLCLQAAALAPPGGPRGGDPDLLMPRHRKAAVEVMMRDFTGD